MKYGHAGSGSKKNKKSKKAQRGVELVLLMSLVIVMFYMWGRVRIDTVIRDQSKLENQKTILISEINTLRVEVNSMKSYTNILARVKAHGIGVIPAARRSELAVDTDDITSVLPVRRQLHVAGMGIWQK
ncbi:hypothetical protein KAR48_15785 [bacterium]|nr:hypothetical protein [bacterium]